jgi:hypothetical protein
MFVKRKGPARELGELCDPFTPEGELIHDRPNPLERSAYAEQYDAGVEAALARAGVLRDHPNFDAIYRDAVNSDNTLPSGEPMEHGHELPMSKRDALLYAPQSVWEQARAEGESANALLAEYQRRNPDLAHDLDGLNAAVDAALEWYDERAERPMDNPGKFISDVASFHRGGIRPQYEHSHRTAGIGAGSGTYRPDHIHPNPDDDQGLVGDIREIQRRSGFY